MIVLKDTDRVFVAKKDNYVIKRFRKLSDKNNKNLLGKLERINDTSKISGLIVPEYYETKNGVVKEIYTKYVDLPNLDYGVTDFETITKCLINLEKILKKAHQEDICLLDFTTSGNLKYNPDSCEVYALDYEDMQIGNNLAFACSSKLIQFLSLDNDKYYSDSKFTKESDIFLLIMFWFRLCTYLELPDVFNNPANMLRTVNLHNDEVARNVLLCYDLNRNNEYVSPYLDKTHLLYTLEFDHERFLRKFIRK